MPSITEKIRGLLFGVERPTVVLDGASWAGDNELHASPTSWTIAWRAALPLARGFALGQRGSVGVRWLYGKVKGHRSVLNTRTDGKSGMMEHVKHRAILTEGLGTK